MATVTSADGFDVTSAHESEEDMRVALEIPEPPEVPDGEPEPKPAAVAEEPKPAEKPRAAKPRDDAFARVKDATAKEAAAKRERDEARAELDRLKAENARLSSQYQAPREDPKPSAPPAPEKFPSYQEMLEKNAELTPEQWLDQRDDWRDQQRAAVQARHASEAAYQSHLKRLNDRISAIEKDEPGFWSRVQPLAQRLVPSMEVPKGQRITGVNALADRILKSEKQPELLRHFTDNPTDFQRISTLHPEDFYWEMGKLEARLEAAPATGSARQAPVVSQANAPLKPVSASPPISDDGVSEEDLPFDEFARRRNAKERSARR